MNRLELIEAVVAAASRPIPAVTKSHSGGFAFVDGDGSTYSPQFFRTREEAVAWAAESRARADESFRAQLQRMDDEGLAGQVVYWIRAGR